MLDENFSIHYCAFDFMNAVSELASQSIPDWDKNSVYKIEAFKQYLFNDRHNGELVYFNPSFDLNCSSFDFEDVVFPFNVPFDDKLTEEFFKLSLKELIEQSEILLKSLKSNGGKQTILLHYSW